MASEAELCRRLRDDFAIGIDRAGATGSVDVNLLAFKRANLLPGVVPTASEGWQQPHEAPQGIHFQAVNVQTAVVDTRPFRYRHAAAVMAAVAYRYVDRAQTDRSDSKSLSPTRRGVIHHTCWGGGQHV